MTVANAHRSRTPRTRLLVRVVISAIVLTILLVFIPLPAVATAIRRTSAWVWVVSLGIFFAGHYLNAMKLRLILGSRLVSRAACVRAQYAGLTANFGLPGLAGGDLVRGAYLAPAVGMKRVALGSVVDRALDTFTLLILAGAALPFAGLPPRIAQPLEKNAPFLLELVAVALVLVLVAVLWARRTRFAPSIDEAWSALGRRWARLLGAGSISLVVQAVFILTSMWLAREVGVTTSAAAWFVAWPLSKLTAILPISLGGLGVREAALVTLLATYGAPADAVLASGILWQGVLAVSGVTGLLVTQASHVSTKEVSSVE